MTSADNDVREFVGSSVSMLPTSVIAEEDAYLSDVIEATVASRAADPQPKLWVPGQQTSNITTFDSFYTGEYTSEGNLQPGLWVENPNASIPDGNDDAVSRKQIKFAPKPFFTSSLLVGTDTGILRALALRIGSSLQCQTFHALTSRAAATIQPLSQQITQMPNLRT